MVSLSDGSGMSSYNRVAPRGTARLLGWIARQPWGDGVPRDPAGGRRQTARCGGGSPGRALAGKICAKTGSLNATNALAGYMTARERADADLRGLRQRRARGCSRDAFMDRALVAIAAAN